jgi:outer membrane protein TolC
MAKPARRKTGEAVITAADRSSKSLQNRSGQATDRDIARRAYELYEQRDRAHGHDIDDWLQAERDLRDSVRLHVA